MFFSELFDIEFPKKYCISSKALLDDICAVEIGYNRTPKGLFQIMKRDRFILHYVVSGCGTFCNENFKENNCYIVVPNEQETIRADEQNPYETYWIAFKGPKAAQIIKKCNIPCTNSVFEFNRTKECAEVLREALELLQDAKEYEESAIMNSVLFKIFAIHFSETTVVDSQIGPARKIAEFINENYFRNISINYLAKSFNFNRSYIYMLFKKEFGISPQEYILNKRIEKAKELLSDRKRLRICEVAFAVGYSDPLYFSRLFKKATGVSPLKFAKNNQPL